MEVKSLAEWNKEINFKTETVFEQRTAELELMLVRASEVADELEKLLPEVTAEIAGPLFIGGEAHESKNGGIQSREKQADGEQDD